MAMSRYIPTVERCRNKWQCQGIFQLLNGVKISGNVKVYSYYRTVNMHNSYMAIQTLLFKVELHIETKMCSYTIS